MSATAMIHALDLVENEVVMRLAFKRDVRGRRHESIFDRGRVRVVLDETHATIIVFSESLHDGAIVRGGPEWQIAFQLATPIGIFMETLRETVQTHCSSILPRNDDLMTLRDAGNRERAWAKHLVDAKKVPEDVTLAMMLDHGVYDARRDVIVVKLGPVFFESKVNR